MKTTNNILLVRVPTQESVDGRELQDYILESLAKGVLVLTEDASCEVMELPPLGGVEIDVPALPPAVESAIESNPPGPEVDAEAAEKRDILQRLLDYRKANGLGCLNVVSAKTAYRKSDRISTNTMRMIITGDAPKLDISEWRKIAKALDVLGVESSDPDRA